MNFPTLLLFAKNGQLGWELDRSLQPLGKVIAIDAAEANFEDPDSVAAVIRQVKPDFIINPAAFTAVDQAEKDIERARKINAITPGVIAGEARRLGAVFIHYSTDYVFDGAKDSPYIEEDGTNPLNAYGQTKLEGEQAIGQIGGAHVILRTSWVYSLRGDGFVSKVLKWARTQETLRIVDDQVGSPSWARALAETTSLMLARGRSDSCAYFSERSGLYHLGGAGMVSRLDFAREILRLDPRREEQTVKRLEPALTADFPTPALRPLRTDLDCSKFEGVFGLCLPGWEVSLQHALLE
jgi:dTDP-4-dehydrorhamnose reductase